MDNVIKYSSENIIICIDSYFEVKVFHYFSFSNTGNTIDKQYLLRIVEKNHCIDSGRSRKTGGTGLGLAIVKNVIQLYKGEITAKNINSGGVKFSFTIEK